MSSALKILSLAEALAGHSAARQAVVARNVAHADTPGYHAADLNPFAETYAARDAAEDGLAFRPAASRPGHAGFDPGGAEGSGGLPAGAELVRDARPGAASPNGNSVALEDQMVRAAEAKLNHDLALGVWRKSLDILRTAMQPPR